MDVPQALVRSHVGAIKPDQNAVVSRQVWSFCWIRNLFRCEESLGRVAIGLGRGVGSKRKRGQLGFRGAIRKAMPCVAESSSASEPFGFLGDSGWASFWGMSLEGAAFRGGGLGRTAPRV